MTGCPSIICTNKCTRLGRHTVAVILISHVNSCRLWGEGVQILGCHLEISKLSHSVYRLFTSAQLLIIKLDLFSVHYPELIMISHLHYLGPLHSHLHFLLGLSCCLLSLSHPPHHFFILLAARNMLLPQLVRGILSTLGAVFCSACVAQPVWHFA